MFSYARDDMLRISNYVSLSLIANALLNSNKADVIGIGFREGGRRSGRIWVLPVRFEEMAKSVGESRDKSLRYFKAEYLIAVFCW